MYERNELTNVVQKIKVGNDIQDAIFKQLARVNRVHSYIVYACRSGDNIVGWKIVYNVSQNNVLNTIEPLTIAEVVLEQISKYDASKSTNVVCYAQPPLDLLILQYGPLVNKLAKEQHDKWKWLEYEDLVQMCVLCICELYCKKYYIHKSLLRRTFNNYVLMHIRKDKDKPVMLSLEQRFAKSDDDKDVTIADTIPDQRQIEALEQEELDAVEQQILEEMKGIIIDLVGPRQYDQLLREYGSKSTTPWSRKLMQKIKAHLFNLGISRKSFDKYYG